MQAAEEIQEAEADIGIYRWWRQVRRVDSQVRVKQLLTAPISGT